MKCSHTNLTMISSQGGGVSSEAELTRTGKREKYSRYFKTPENEDNNQLNHIFGENEHKEDVGIVLTMHR